MTAEALKQAEEACAELHAALAAADIALPSLGVDPIAYTYTSADQHPVALVELGRCNVTTARALAAALRARGGAP